MEFQFEYVERKGIGHPDTIADALANEFSRAYSQYCMREMGGIPRHSIDKLVLVGSTSRLGFGFGDETSPIRCFVGGKLIEAVGSHHIPVIELLETSIERVFNATLDSRWKDLLQPVVIVDGWNAGVGAEHPPHYYSPSRKEELDDLSTAYDANDTAIIFGYARATLLESLVLTLEQEITSPKTRTQFGVGTDVKVLASRNGESLSLHVAIPFIASEVSTEVIYRERLSEISYQIKKMVSYMAPSLDLVCLNINTKDRPGHGYLTLVGSALDKGDQGCVGRGNGHSGLISMMRPYSMESHAGKNPIRSAGRIYPFLCQKLSRMLDKDIPLRTTIGLQSGNGLPLHEPSDVFAILPNGQKYAMGQVDLSWQDIHSARVQLLDPSQLEDDLTGRIQHVPERSGFMV